MIQFDSVPDFEAGCRMPSMLGIEMNEANVRAAAEVGSSRLLLAMLRYGLRHGLPRMSQGDCRAALDERRVQPPKVDRRHAGYRRSKPDEWSMPQHRAALALRRNGLSYREIGNVVGRSPSAVASRLRDYGGVSEL